MRLVAAALFWLVTTIALTVAVPATWAQTRVIDVDGFAKLAQSAARDPRLQQAIASELTTQIVSIAEDRGYEPDSDTVRSVASAYTASSAFPGQFAQATRIVHRWMFTGAGDQSGDRWTVDLAPMLADTSFQRALEGVGVDVPSSVTVPVMVSDHMRPGQLQPLTTYGPWVSVGAAVFTGVSALLTLALARQRGKALAALGVSALLVGAAGWAGIEVARGRIDNALNDTTGGIRRIAEVMVAHAEDSAHYWLNVTLGAGGALVILGVILTVLGSVLWTR